MIPHQGFTCPHCGAPGMVNMGQAEYSCQCRFTVQPFQCRHIPIYDNMAKDYRCQVCGVFTREQGAPIMGSVPSGGTDA